MKKLPYLAKGREILYLSAENKFMIMAKDFAKSYSLDKGHPTGAIIVKGDDVLGRGANGSVYHQLHGCERKRQNIPTGERYDLCEGCSPVNHAEQTAIANAKDRGNDCKGADLYLYGHWWCCKSCWDKMIEVGIRNVYLVKTPRQVTAWTK
jgi:deoxycytidylate deaminase